MLEICGLVWYTETKVVSVASPPEFRDDLVICDQSIMSDTDTIFLVIVKTNTVSKYPERGHNLPRAGELRRQHLSLI